MADPKTGRHEKYIATGIVVLLFALTYSLVDAISSAILEVLHG